jgi:hypothetical protein
VGLDAGSWAAIATGGGVVISLVAAGFDVTVDQAKTAREVLALRRAVVRARLTTIADTTASTEEVSTTQHPPGAQRLTEQEDHTSAVTHHFRGLDC